MSHFLDRDPTLENYWRSVILFGQNVASYKFALAKSLIELSGSGEQTITLEQLAEPFSRHIVEHLSGAPKQATSVSSRFLDSCKRFSTQEISKDELIGQTVKLGFQNVIDAFHVVNRAEIPVRFFRDGRRNVAEDILDRLVHNAHRIEMRGDSMRKTRGKQPKRIAFAVGRGRGCGLLPECRSLSPY